MHLSTSNFERNETYLRILAMDSLRTTNCGVSHDVLFAAGGSPEVLGRMLIMTCMTLILIYNTCTVMQSTPIYFDDSQC